METFFMSTVLFSLFLGLLFTEAAPQDALITHLPGFNGVFPSKHYSGYVTVDEEVGKNLFYYFVVSERNPIQDPVVLWLNGGPGCSSFGGFVYEHGSGYMVGNGVTDKVFDGNARVSFAHGMGLISDNLFEAVTSACNGSFWDPIMDSRCWNLLQKVHENVKNLNIYDILEPCYQNPKAKETENVDAKTPSGFRRLGETDRPLPVRERMFGHAWPNRAPVRDGVVPEPLIPTSVDCTDESVANLWLNDKIVRKALHGRKNLTWWLCIIILDYDRDLLGNMIPYHRNLTTRGYRALIYSGDHDMSVPFTGSEAWTRSLGYKILDEWRPWFVNDDVAGFTQGYDHNLTFLTIMGAGHTVPTYKPKEALAFYSRWLAAEKI